MDVRPLQQLLRARLLLEDALHAAQHSRATGAASEVTSVLRSLRTTDWFKPVSPESDLQLLDDALEALGDAASLLANSCRELSEAGSISGFVKPQKLNRIRGRVRIHLASISHKFTASHALIAKSGHSIPKSKGCPAQGTIPAK